jgi:ABC-type uncharacterized transport system substrate-binding protein
LVRNFLLVIIAIIFLGSTAAQANDILVVQGLRVKPFDDAFRGFRETCDADMRRVYLSDYAEPDLARVVRQNPPRLILSIGADALAQARKIRGIPIIYLMVLNIPSLQHGNGNITGIDMNVPPERYLDILAHIEPRPKNIGIIYDQVKTGTLIRRAKRAAYERGMVIKALAVNRANDVPHALNSLQGRTDALLMLPDMTVVTPETVESFLLFSQNNNVPVVAFAAKYVDMGALISLDIDGTDMGRQAGEMARLILSGTPVSNIPRAEARISHLKVNRTVARKLGLAVDADDWQINISQP